MTDLSGNVGTWLTLLLIVFLILLALGVNFAPDWVKSRGFLLVATVLVVLGSNSFY